MATVIRLLTEHNVGGDDSPQINPMSGVRQSSLKIKLRNPKYDPLKEVLMNLLTGSVPRAHDVGESGVCARIPLGTLTSEMQSALLLAKHSVCGGHGNYYVGFLTALIEHRLVDLSEPSITVAIGLANSTLPRTRVAQPGAILAERASGRCQRTTPTARAVGERLPGGGRRALEPACGSRGR
jgi:hypothetical protein